MNLRQLSDISESEHASLVKAATEYAGPGGIVAYSSGQMPSPHTIIHFRIGSLARDFANKYNGKIGPSWLSHRGATACVEIPHKRSAK